MLVIIVSWLVWFPIFSGIGLLMWRYFGLRTGGIETLLLCFWIGWSCTILVLQLWHLWFRVDESAQILAAIAGLCGLIWNRAMIWEAIKHGLRTRKGALLLFLVLGIWLANRTNAPIANFDTGLYHLASVQWLNAYPIVPGLGNLYAPLALNSSFFLYAAMLNVGFWDQKAYVIANGLLWFVFMTQIIFYLSKLIYERSTKITHLFYTLLIGILFTQAFGDYAPQFPLLRFNISNVSPDIPVTILGVIISGLVLSLLTNPGYSENEQRYYLVCIAILAGVGVTIKLSLMALGLSAMGIATAVWLSRHRQRSAVACARMLSITALYTMSLLLPWAVRGIILSGYPAYPSTTGALDVDWRVLRSLTITLTNAIRGGSRNPRIPWYDVLDNYDWLQPWLYVFLHQKFVHLTIVALVLAVACMCIPVGEEDRPRLRWLFLLPAALSVVFWFVLAPAMRYVGASFWVLAAGLTAIAAERIALAAAARIPIVRWLPLGLCAAFLIYIIPFRLPFWNPPYQQSADGLYPVPQVPYRSLATKSGLVVNLPVTGFQCWAIPLPCTPSFSPNLRLRDDSSMRLGFRLDRPSTLVDTYWTNQPAGVRASANIGVLLPRIDSLLPGGWYEFEPKNNLRWMQSPGRILVYVDQDTPARVSLDPLVMNVNQSFGTVGQLRITLNGELITTLPVKTRVTNDILLPFHQGFNIIKMELVAGNFIPAQVDPNNRDTRALSISFYSIKITALRSREEP